MPEQRTRISYFIESRPHRNAPWQRATGVAASWESGAKARARLAARREMQPNWEHRLMERTTTVTERPAGETAAEEQSQIHTHIHVQPDPSHVADVIRGVRRSGGLPPTRY
ncbi:hypothetical protein [Streptomyces seoulensis]|uniref:hypothetical protein n=1 Tax=Streptomyces seoulensis TaxID=73044 RepID=UPI001FCB0717|nr:hypothetical protein [Streptomyces seoulensis]BDH04875.1 hypothetical protein HEK131_21020 [Streptomyces seoulensis]